MGINIHTWLINYELDQMSRYIDLIQASLGQRFEEIEEAYRKDMALEKPEDEYDLLENHYIDEFIEIGSDLPRLIYSSFVVAWYSFVEQKLLALFDKLNPRISVGPKDSQNLGKGIRRVRKLLLKAINYEIQPTHWQDLVEIGRLRNFIVHEGTKVMGSYLPSENETVALKSDDDIGNTFFFEINQALFRYMQKHNLVDHSGMFLEIAPSFDYCKYLVEFGKELLGKLYSDLRPKM